MIVLCKYIRLRLQQEYLTHNFLLISSFIRFLRPIEAWKINSKPQKKDRFIPYNMKFNLLEISN